MSQTLESKTFLPESLDQDLDRRFREIVLPLTSDDLTEKDKRPRLVLGEDAIELSSEMVDIIRYVLEAMRRGMAVSIVPQHTTLSTQQAADLLGVSRPTLIRILDDGGIRFFRKRRHRQLYLIDVLEYQQKQRRVADESLSDIVADAEMFGEYDVDPEEYLEAARAVRRGE